MTSSKKPCQIYDNDSKSYIYEEKYWIYWLAWSQAEHKRPFWNTEQQMHARNPLVLNPTPHGTLQAQYGVCVSRERDSQSNRLVFPEGGEGGGTSSRGQVFF